MARDRLSSLPGVAAAVAAALVAAGLHLAWMARDGAIPGGDDVLHLAASWNTATEFLSTRHAQKSFLLYFSGYTNGYPPLFYWTYTLLFVLGAGHGAAAAMALQVFVLPLTAGLLWMGHRVAGIPGAAVAALAGLGAPAATLFARQCYLDFPLLACVAAATALLLASDGFRRRAGSVGFALALAAAMLLKWTALLFLLPVAWLAWSLGSDRPLRSAALSGLGALAGLGVLGALAWEAAGQGPEPGPRLALWGATMAAALLGTMAWVGRDRGRRFHLALTWVVPLALAGPWYFAFAPALRRHLGFVLVRQDFDLPLPAHEAGSWVVALAMARDGLLAPAVLLATLAALAAVLAGRARAPDVRVLAGGLAISFLIVAAMPFKDVRYLLPLVAFAAPLAAWSPSLLPRTLRGPAWGALALSGLLPLVGWLLPLPGARPVTWPDWTRARLLQYSPPPALGWLPEPRPWKRELVAHVEALGAGVVRWPRGAGPLPNWLNLEARRRGLPVYFDRDGRFPRPSFALEPDPEGDWEVPGARLRLRSLPGGALPDLEDLAHAQVPPPLPLWRPELRAWYVRSDPHSEWAPR